MELATGHGTAGVAMSLHALIQGAAFEPEVVEAMGQAYETARKLIGADQPPLVMETIAKSIIDSARSAGATRRKWSSSRCAGSSDFPMRASSLL
jgi:hypothetical protein